MAKKKATPKIYPISRKVCKEGYNVKIDGVYLTVDPCKMELVTRGKQKVWAVEKQSPVYQTLPTQDVLSGDHGLRHPHVEIQGV